MPPPPLSPAEILSAAENPADKGLYFLGAYHRRITFFSQQVRALRLAEALKTLNVINADDQVAVVGGGAGGATMAAALALLGKDVSLFDPAEKVLQLQSASSRLLHPHIYEWPQLGSLDARAGLPILDWQSDKAGTVCDALRGEFDKLRPSLPNLRPKLKHDVTSLERDGDSWKLGLDTPEGKETRVFQPLSAAPSASRPRNFASPTGIRAKRAVARWQWRRPARLRYCLERLASCTVHLPRREGETIGGRLA